MAELSISIPPTDAKVYDSSDLSYLLDVLKIEDVETEDQLDERLRSEAKNLGVEIEQDAVPKEKSQSISTASSSESPRTRRSQSTTSKASHSTGLTSICSEKSQDKIRSRSSRPSLSLRDYDAFLARGMPMGNTIWSFPPITPTSTSASSFSLPLSQPSQREPARKKSLRRVLGRLKTGLNVSSADLLSTCPHCPVDGPGQRTSTHRLPCGHRLCKDGLRNTISEALSGGLGAVPSCCRVPIPGRLVEQVMTQPEQDNLLEKLNQWDEAISLTALPNWPQSPPSLPPLPCLSPLPRPYPSRSLSNHSRTDSVIAHSPSITKYSSRSDYRNLISTQTAQRSRLDSWISSRRSSLTSSHDLLRKSTLSAHEASLDELADQHASDLAEAEDKHVVAEAEVREAQTKSLRDASIALRHMEAFCRGVYSDGTSHFRPVGPREREELAKARREREAMGLRHASAINVLRGEQGRRLKTRMQRQEKEMQELRKGLRMEELEIERACTAEMNAFEEEVLGKEARLGWRWEIERAIFAAKVELEEREKERVEEEAKKRMKVQRMVEAQGYATGFMIR